MGILQYVVRHDDRRYALEQRAEEQEKEALEAGTVCWDAELFSGTPDWDKLKQVAPITLTKEEREFRYSRQYVLTPSDTANHVRRLSDHYLVLTTVRILPDDD